MAEDNKFEQAKGNIKETVGNATDNKKFRTRRQRRQNFR